MRALPFRSPVLEYEAQARMLLDAVRSGDRTAIDVFRRKHPRFLSEKVPWLPKRVSEDEIRAASLDIDDARLAVARWYDFQTWESLQEWAHAVLDESSSISQFESAVEAVIDGDMAALQRLLDADSDLVRARSTRVAPFDPPRHHATLLHYVGANGVESYRQRTPSNAVDITKALLTAGADVDALADMYGSKCTTLNMVLSSSWPAQAGLQIPLAETLLDAGANIEGGGTSEPASPLMTALAFGYPDAAHMLARRGARVSTAAAAAGLGRMSDVQRLLPGADAIDRHRALAIAAQLGHTSVVRLLLDAGEDPNRYNPRGLHAHGTPLHHAAGAGHLAVAQLLVERGARLDAVDTIFESTPLGWAVYCGQPHVAEFLRERGAC